MSPDNNKVNAILLTDLSKAFDCLPHRLLISKLKTYGLDNDACTLVASYFCDRNQRVKIGSYKSGWLNVIKGAPQGSLFGPFAYNVFSNDLLVLLSTTCDIYITMLMITPYVVKVMIMTQHTKTYFRLLM